jgi:hypothetical protein
MTTISVALSLCMSMGNLLLVVAPWTSPKNVDDASGFSMKRRSYNIKKPSLTILRQSSYCDNCTLGGSRTVETAGSGLLGHMGQKEVMR